MFNFRFHSLFVDELDIRNYDITCTHTLQFKTEPSEINYSSQDMSWNSLGFLIEQKCVGRWPPETAEDHSEF